MTTPVTGTGTSSGTTSIYQQLGIAQQQPTRASSGDTLDMNSFLTLMTEQMKNQDPTKPMDSSAYLGQLAQFANLQGVQQLNTGMTQIQSLMGQLQSISVTGLVGHDAYIKTDTMDLSGGKAVDGRVTATAPGQVDFTVKDGAGNVVRSFTAQATEAGPVDFSWDGKADNGQALPDGTYTISAKSGSTSLDTQVGCRINSVSFTSQGIVINVEGHDGVNFDQILSIS